MKSNTRFDELLEEINSALSLLELKNNKYITLRNDRINFNSYLSDGDNTLVINFYPFDSKYMEILLTTKFLNYFDNYSIFRTSEIETILIKNGNGNGNDNG